MFSAAINKGNTPKRVLTSQDVEKYVQKVQGRIQSPAEKKTKAFAFARLYYDAKDYNLSKKYLEDYLSIQDRDFRVHNLMGEVQEALENYPDALSSYKRSLELCSSQKDILIKVLLLWCKCPLDPLRAKVWADKGARLCPGHPAVFELKWYLLSLEEEKDFEEMELLLADELSRRARVASLHIKLANMYVEAGSLKRAHLHCQSVEKTGAFNTDIEWLECASNIFDQYRLSGDEDTSHASLLFVQTLCKLMNLHLKCSTTRVCSSMLKRFDKTVFELINHGPQHVMTGLTTEWKDCTTEMKGQLYLSAAVFIMKLAQEGALPWMKANKMMCAFVMSSWLIDVPYITSKLFARHSPLKQQTPQAYDWSVLACARLSQAGHVILSLESQFGEEWQKGCIANYCSEQGRFLLLTNLYGSTDIPDQSFLATDSQFIEVEVKIPDPHDLVKYDEVTVAEHAQDLHLIIWLGLHWDKLNERMRPGVGVMVGRLFEGISLDVKNMKSCNYSSLCLRDVEAFVYAVIRSSKSIHLECHKEEDELRLLPLEISVSLVTTAQSEWWQAAYGLYTGKVGTQSAAKLKVILQKGIETMRCIRDHGIDPRILVYISVAFWEKALSIQSAKQEEYDYQDHWESLQARATYYMKEAVRILEIYKRNRTIPIVDHPLILPLSEPLLLEEILSLLSKTYLKLAESAMFSGELESALTYYEEVKSLQSVYSQSQIYIGLASKSDLKTVQGEKDHLYYLTKAKEKLSICISNSDHSPEFKQSLIEQLKELQFLTERTGVIPRSKKSLDFKALIPDIDVGIDESATFSNSTDVSSILESSMLQEQLDAKESENRNLKQALVMYKAQIDMQRQQHFAMHSQQIVPSHVLTRQQLMQRSSSNGSNPMTPLVQNGLETPSDMWWDSFSPQPSFDPSFEKDYFSGLAEHVEQIREETGEGVAPTLKDQPTEGTPKQAGNVSNVSAHTPSSPAYETDDIYVEPIVKLTSRNDLTTGEEEEILKFVHRAKLYRFDKDSSQWKERGIGDVKILLNEKSKKGRITMRREQVLRLCCNHSITTDMHLTSKAGAKSAWSWFTAADATDEEVRPEQFTIKFKTQEIADQFHDAFAQCQNIVKKSSGLGQNVIEDVNSKQISSLLKEKLAPKVGSWSCETCLVSNPPDCVKCLACQTMKLGNVDVVGVPSQSEQQFGHATPVIQQPAILPQQQTSQTQPHLFGTPQVQAQLFGTPQAHTQLFDVPQADLTNNLTNTQSPFQGFGTRTDPVVAPFSFKTSESVITESPEGRPVFNFANTQQTTTTLVNPFFAKQPLASNQWPLPQTGNAEVASFPTISNTTSASNNVQIRQADSTVTTLPPFHLKPDTFKNNPMINQTEVKSSPVSSFSFKVQTTTTSTVSSTIEVTSAESSSPFSGFSFSAKSSTNVNQPIASSAGSNESITSSAHNNHPVTSSVQNTITQYFPMMSSLLKDSSSPPARAEVSTSPVIAGMNTLPVFGKGVVNTGVDPSSFWTSGSPQKPFFTGNTTALEAIGHKALEEPREIDEEEFFNDNMKANNEYNEEFDENEYYYGENGEYDCNYNHENYGDNYDYNPDEDFSYDNEDDYQPSQASSSRRGSNDDDDDDVDIENENDKQVEERFDIQKRQTDNSIDQVIDDDLIITYEIKPSFAQKIRASRLQLPSTFFLYQSKPPCPGCRGCVKDFDETNRKQVATSKQVTSSVNPVTDLPVIGLSSASNQSKFGGTNNQSKFGTFASLASSSQSGFSGSSGGTFIGAGAQLFSSVKSEDQDDGGEYDPHYEALVQVTKLGEIKTGEEDDEEMFKHRAKLYRHDTQWKERGVGDIKLTRNVKTGYCRVIMRRDQVHKLCANHAIMPNMELQYLLTSDKSLVWFAPSDYSEGMPPVPQRFCVKFKNRQISEEFKEMFEMCKELMAVKLASLENEEVETVDSSEPISAGLASKFAAKSGEWECSSCLVRNQADARICVCCNEDKEKSTIEPRNTGIPFAQETVNASQPDETFGKTMTTINNLAAKFASKPGEWECPECLLRNKADIECCVACESPNPNDRDIAIANASKNLFAPKVDSPFKFGTAGDSGKVESPFKFGTVGDSGRVDAPFKFGSASGKADAPFKFVTAGDSVNSTSSFTFGAATKPLLATQTGSSETFKFGSSVNSVDDGLLATPLAVEPRVNETTVGSTEVFEFDASVKSVDDGLLATPLAVEPRVNETTVGSTEAFEFGASIKSVEDGLLETLRISETKQSLHNTSKDSPTKFHEEEYDIHVEAIAQVTKLENTVTGEEDDETIFIHRAKLFRFDSSVKQWEERGIGDIKLTRNIHDNKCRVLMRREQIHKLCANHAILAVMELKPLNNSATWTWFTQADYCDGEVKAEHFCAKFKTAEIANKFKDSFEMCKEIVKGTKSNVVSADVMQVKPEEVKKKDLKSMFAPKVGSWECPTCLIQNEGNASSCAACQSPNPNGSTDETGPTGASNSSPFSFGTNKPDITSASFSFGSKPDATASSFSFGSNPDAATSSFSFGSKTDSTVSPFSFGKPADTGAPTHSPFSSGQKQESEVSLNKQNNVNKFMADPDTWECPSCLSKNDSRRERCHSCDSIREKTPVVRLDPKDFSTPIDLQIKSALKENSLPSSSVGHLASNAISFGSTSPDQEKSNVTSMLFVTPKKSPVAETTETAVDSVKTTFGFSDSSTGFTFGSIASSVPPAGFSFDQPTVLNSGFTLNKDTTAKSAGFLGQELTKPNMTSKAAADKELMPPPIGIPAKGKGSPKHASKKSSPKQDSIFSWMPKGLNSGNLFSFGTNPSPSLSAASSIDDIPQHSSQPVTEVLPAFNETTFTFRLSDPNSNAPVTPTKSVNVTVKSPTSPKTPGDGEDTTIEFTPLVTLTQVDHKCGEENENILFASRSKMFRFDGQWKERGTGEIKILQHKTNEQCRLLMRRDQTHTLCANHGLLCAMTIKPMSGSTKAFIWKTNADISDGTAKEQMFAARFKEEETASLFSDVFTEACAGVITNNTEENESATTVDDDKIKLTKGGIIEIEDSDSEDLSESVSDECEIIYESDVDDDLRRRAKQLLLPSMFYYAPSVIIGNVLPRKTSAESSTTMEITVVADRHQSYPHPVNRDASTVIIRSTKDSETMTEQIQSTAELMLTHEKLPESAATQKSEAMLLPRTFYNFKESSKLRSEVVEIDTSDDATAIKPVLSKSSHETLFEKPAVLFKFIRKMNEFCEGLNGEVKIMQDRESKAYKLIVAEDDAVILSHPITRDITMALKESSKAIFDWQTPSTPLCVPEGKFALKFNDVTTAEAFKKGFDDCCTKTSGLTEASVHSNVFGSSSTIGLSFTSLGTSSGGSGFESNVGKSFANTSPGLFQQNCSTDDNAGLDNGNIYVEPIVQLSSVTVSTGEEEEHLIFNQRCKLYKFDQGKWKERGVGELKLLKHKTSGKARLVMRRDQVRKLCANHALVSSIKLEPFNMNELAVTWNAIGDISDNSPENCVLAAKFKSQVILSDFKLKFTALCNDKEVELLSPKEKHAPDGERVHGTCDVQLNKVFGDVNVS